MAMYRDKVSIGGAASDALMITGGFVAGGFLGNQVEKSVKPGVTEMSSTADKLLAGAANNAPKLAGYYLLTTVGMSGAAAAMIGSAAYDILIRLTNGGINPVAIYTRDYGNYRIMRQQQAMAQAQQITPPNMPGQVASMQQDGRVGSLPFEQWDEKSKRERKYGFASSVPLKTKADTAASMFGMY